jgi:hypothetical protein
VAGDVIQLSIIRDHNSSPRYRLKTATAVDNPFNCQTLPKLLPDCPSPLAREMKDIHQS